MFRFYIVYYIFNNIWPWCHREFHQFRIPPDGLSRTMIYTHIFKLDILYVSCNSVDVHSGPWKRWGLIELVTELEVVEWYANTNPGCSLVHSCLYIRTPLRLSRINPQQSTRIGCTMLGSDAPPAPTPSPILVHIIELSCKINRNRNIERLRNMGHYDCGVL